MRVVDAHASVSVEATGESRPVVEVEVREVLKGKGAPGDVVRFASHGHGVARYDDGEEALSTLLPRGQRAVFNFDAVLRADTQTRYDAYETGLRAGFLTIDEVRALEGLT